MRKLSFSARHIFLLFALVGVISGGVFYKTFEARIVAALTSVSLSATVNEDVESTADLGSDNGAYRWSYDPDGGGAQAEQDFMAFNMPFNTGTTQTDFGGSSKTGTATNMVSPHGYVTSGKAGGAMSFDGANDYVSLSGTHGGGAEATISAWVNIAADTGTFQTIVGVSGEAFVHFQINYPGGAGNISVYTNAGQILLPMINVSTGAWHHIVLSLKTGALKAYVDGNLVSTNTTAFSTITSTTDLSIGRGYAGGRFFNGSIDEVQIYNSALTEAQIDQLCNDGDSDGDCSDGIDVGQGVGGPTVIDSSHTAFGQVWDLTVTPVSSAGIIGTAIDSSTTATVVPMALSSSVNVADNIVSSFSVAPPVSSTVGYQWTVDGSRFTALNIPFNVGTTQTDISGNGINGTASGSTFNLSSSGNCQVGGCMSFDGNDSVSLGTSSPFRQSDAVSYSFWTKMPNGGGGYTMGAGASGGHGYGGIIHSLTSFGFNWTPTNPGSDRLLSATLALTADQWHHIVFAIDYVNQTAALYVDGNSVSLTLSSSASDWTPVSSYNSGKTDYIGARYVNSLQYFNGYLDEVQLYPRALSAAQIDRLYDDGANVIAGDRGGPTEIVPAEHNLVEVWQLNALEFDSAGNVGSAINIGSATIVDTFLTDISGTCLQANGVDLCGANTIKVAVNSVLQAGKEDTVVDGGWSIADVSVYAGDVITVFIDGGAEEWNEAVAITKYVSGNITGMQLIEEHLTIGSADNQTITNADLGQYDNSVSGDEDIFHDVTGSDLVSDVQAHSAHTLMVLTGNTFAPGGSVSTSGSWDNNGSFLAGGALSVTTLNNTSGTLDLNGQSLTVATTFTNGGTIQLKGTETISLPGGATVGAWKYVGSGVGSTLAVKDFGATDYSALIFDDTNGTLDTFTVNDITVSGATTLTAGQMSIASGTFTTGSYTQNGGSFSSSGGAYVGTTNTFTCTSGTFDSPSGGFTEAGDVLISGTCIFNQGGAMTVGGNLQVLSGGVFNGSNTGAAIDVNGSVDFQSTADTVRLTSGTMTVAGDWTNRVPLIGFDNNAGTVRLDTSSAAAVNGSTVWRNLVIEPAGKTVTFEAGELQMIETGGDLSATGASGNLINFVSSDPTTPTQWEIDHEDVNTGNLSYVSVTDGGCFNSDNIFLLTSTSVSNNDDCWKFLVTQNISGSYDGADGSTVRVAVDGTLSPVTTTTSGGLFTLTNVDLVSAGRVLVFVDGVVDANEAMAMTKYDGAGDITGVQLLQGHLTIGSDDNATVSNADLALYDNSVSLDEDIFFEVDANNDLVVDVEGGHTETLMIVAGNTFQPDSGSSGNVTTHHLRIDGVLTADANTITVGGAWDNNGTFNAGTSTVVLSGAAQNISGSTSFYSLTKSVTAPDTLTIDDNTTISTLSGGVLTLTGTSLVNKLTIRSNPDSGSTQWFMTHHASATESVSFVDLKDAGCTASSDISLPSGSIDSGNNDACWVFTLGDATQLDFGTAPPSSATIDQTWSSFTVRIEDEYGNLRSGDTNDVTIALSTGTGTLSGTTTKAAVGGVATFDDISYDTIETITIEATSGGVAGTVQWTVDGVAVSIATNSQSKPQLASDGSGGSIITWYDIRSGLWDIYAQRLNASGVAQWTANGVAISTATNTQELPEIVSDGSGGAIITWQDLRSGTNDIYAQRVNASGAVQWTADGVAVSTATSSQSNPQIVSDGSGGAIITWQDFRSGTVDIYAQRINASGVVQWTANGVAISTATSTQSNPQIVSDGSSGAIITWQDFRNSGTTGTDIYVQRINASGVVQWTANGVAISIATSTQSDPQIVTDGSGGAIITWNDSRNSGTTSTDIYARRINASGVVQWTANGVAISTATNIQSNPQIVSDGSGGAIITWQDSRSGTVDIYAQRINTSGAVQWTANGVAVTTASGDQWGQQIATDGSGGAIIIWHDFSTGIYDIYAERIDASGAVQWTANGVAVSTATGDQWRQQIVSDGLGGAFITWEDNRSGNYDIYAQKISGGGLTPVESGNIIVTGHTLSGRLYSDEGVTAVTSADQDVTILVNGVVVGTDTTDASGDYAVTNVLYSGDDVITVFVDEEIEKAVLVTLAPTSPADITGLDLYYDHLIVRHENAGPLTNANLGTADNADADINAIYSEAGGVVTVEGGKELSIWTGNTYAPGGNISLGGNWDNNGTFTAGTSTVDFTGANQNISGNTTFYSLTKSVTAPDTLTIDDSTTISTLSGGVLTLTGTSLVNKLTIRSNPDTELTDPETSWSITHDAGADELVQYVDLQDAGCTASSAVTVTPGWVDSGNNDACWVFTVGDAAQLNFGTAPSSSALVGQTWSSFTVRIEDEYGNLRTGDTDDVTIALSTGTGTLSGTTTKGAVNGVATFDDISYDTIETITIEATSGGGGSVQWTVNGVAVSAATGTQWRQQIVSDGSGGSIITWQDNRNGNYDIYAQRINASGAVQWTADGVVISAAAGTQSNPQIISDGAGGAIITWEENYDIYAQRINASGVVQWTANGVAVSTATGGQGNQQIVSDGSGGAIITWWDARSDLLSDIYAQRIDASGVVQWTANGVAISTATGTQTNPQISSDGSGGGIITWQDQRSGNWDIYAQKINASGAVQWTVNGVAISTATGTQELPQIVSDGSGGAIITWEDNRNGNYDIYAQRINASGAVQWTADGVVISAAAGNRFDPRIISDGSGGGIITWKDFRSGNYDIYAQRINSSGVAQWTADGVVISAATGYQQSSQIVSDGSGGAIITWGDTDIYAQRINASGVVQWTVNGVAISTATGTQELPQIVSDGSGGGIITWKDFRSGNYDIYAQRISGGVGLIPVESGNIIVTGYSISGRLYSDEGVTAVTSADQDVTILVNGVVAGTDTTDASGDYAVTNVSYSGDDVITVFVDGEIEKAVLVTLAPTSSADITGLDLYYDHLIVRHENAGPLTNANLGTADNADADINAIYSEAGGVVTVAAGKELLVWTGDTYTPGGNVDTSDLQIDGTMVAEGNTLFVDGNWFNAGTFTAGTSTVDFTAGSGTQTLDAGGSSFSTLTHSGAGALQLAAALTVTTAFNNDAGTFDLNGFAWTMTGASFSNAGSLVLQGNETITGLVMDTDSGTIRLVGDGPAGTTTFVLDDAYFNLTIDADATETFEQSGNTVIANTLQVTSGTYDQNGFSTAVNGASTLIIDGGTYDQGGDPLTVEGDLQVLNSGVFNGSNSGAAIDLNGDFSVTNGTFNSTNGTLSFSGQNFTSGAGFVHNSGTVVFDRAGSGQIQTVEGSATYNNFTKITADTQSLIFDQGNTTTVLGALVLKGDEVNDVNFLTIESNFLNSQAILDRQGTVTVSNLVVRDSRNIGSEINAAGTNSSSGGNNFGWNFSGGTYGRVYSNEGTTLMTTTTITVRLVVNDEATVYLDDINANGEFDFAGVTFIAGDVLTFYLENETADAVTVVVASGDSAPGIDLYQNYLIVRHGSGGTVTNAHLTTAHIVGETDITNIYNLTGGITTLASKELLIWTGSTYQPGGNVNIGTGGIDINGTFAMEANAISVTGSWDATGGTTTSTGTVTFSGTGVTITPNSQTFNHVNFTSLGNKTIAGDMTVSGNIIYTPSTNGHVFADGVARTITLLGDFSLTGAGTNTFGDVYLTLKLSGGADQILTDGASPIFGAHLLIDKTAGTVSLGSDFSLIAARNFTMTAGTFNAGASVFTSAGPFLMNDGLVTASSVSNIVANSTFTQTNGTVEKITFGGAAATLTQSGGTLTDVVFAALGNKTIGSIADPVFTISGDITHAPGLNGKVLSFGSGARVDLFGDFSTSGTGGYTFGDANLTLKLTGGADQILTTAASPIFGAHLLIDKSGGVVSLGSSFATTAGRNFTMTAGTFNAGASVFTSAGPFLMNLGTVTGDLPANIVASSTFTQTGGTIDVMTFNSSAATLTQSGGTLTDVVFAALGNKTIGSIADPVFTISGDITHAPGLNGKVLPFGSGARVDLFGDFSTSGTGGYTFGDANLTLKLTGGADQILTTAASPIFGAHLLIDKSGGVVSLGSSFATTAGSNFTMTLGTLDAGASVFTSAGPFLMNGGLVTASSVSNIVANSTFTQANGTVEKITFGGAAATLTQSGGTLTDVTFNNTAVKTIGSDLDISGDLTINSGNTSGNIVTNGTWTISLSGDYQQTTGSATTFGDAGLTLEFTGTNLQTFNKSVGIFNPHVRVNKSANALQLSSLMAIASTRDLTITSGSVLFLNGQNLTMAGGAGSDFSNEGTVRLTGAEATVTFVSPAVQDIDSGTWEYVGNGDVTAETFTVKDFGTTDYYNLLMNDTNATPANRDTFNSGTLTTANDLAVNSGTLTQTGVVTVNGANSFTLNGGTYNQGNNDLIVVGAMDIISGTFTGSTGGNVIDVGGSFTQTGADFTSTNGEMQIAADFSHSAGTFTHGSGTVRLDTSAAAAVNGSTTWYNLVLEPAGKTVTFEAGELQTFETGGDLSATGTSGNLINLVSSDPGVTQWDITHIDANTINLDYISVADGGCVSSNYLIPTNSTNAGGNDPACWFFGTQAVPDDIDDLVATAGDTLVTLTWTPPVDNGSFIDHYIVEVDGGGGYAVYDNNVSGSPFDVTGLVNATEYSFRVKAVNGVGESGDSNIEVATPAGVPDAVTGVGGVTSHQQVALTWDAAGANGSPVTNYIVEYGETIGFPGNQTTINNGTTTNVDVSGLVNGTEYSFRVAAENAVGTGDYSTVYTATPNAFVPSAPVLLTATPQHTRVALTWSAPAANGAAITDYVVQYDNGITGYLTFNDGVSTSTSALVTALLNDTEYSFRVAAVNVIGTGSYSNVLTATPVIVASSGTQSNVTVSITDFLSFSITNSAGVGVLTPAGDQPFGTGAGVISLNNQNAHDYAITGEYGTPLYTELEISTNSNDGYSVTIYADNTDNRTAVLLRNGGTPGVGSLDQIPDSLGRVADTQGANEALNPATATGIGFRLVKTGTTVDIYGNDEDAQWGSNDTTNALWASPSLGVQKTIFSTLELSSTPMQALINWFIGIDVTQRAGTYSGEVILSALPN